MSSVKATWLSLWPRLKILQVTTGPGLFFLPQAFWAVHGQCPPNRLNLIACTGFWLKSIRGIFPLASPLPDVNLRDDCESSVILWALKSFRAHCRSAFSDVKPLGFDWTWAIVSGDDKVFNYEGGWWVVAGGKSTTFMWLCGMLYWGKPGQKNLELREQTKN